MAVVFGGVLLFSFGLHQLFSPAGDAVLLSLETRRVTVAGTIAASISEPGKLALHGSGGSYILADQAIARSYMGREVRITGVLHETTRVLEMRSIELAEPARTSTLDRASKAP